MQEQQTQQKEQKEEYVSPFEEIKGMGEIQAFNILVQAANAAQRAGALSTKDSVLVAKAAEVLQDSLNNKSK